MNPELIVAAMLNVAGVTNLVGNRRAMGQLPQNTAFPALVYTIVDATPMPHLNYSVERQMARARIQINPIAKSIPEVKSILDAIRAAMDFKLQQVYATKTVISSRLELLGPIEKDDDLGVWTQSVDYMLMWYE
jgi:ribosome maturation protein Sdo1